MLLVWPSEVDDEDSANPRVIPRHASHFPLHCDSALQSLLNSWNKSAFAVSIFLNPIVLRCTILRTEWDKRVLTIFYFYPHPNPTHSTTPRTLPHHKTRSHSVILVPCMHAALQKYDSNIAVRRGLAAALGAIAIFTICEAAECLLGRGGCARLCNSLDFRFTYLETVN
jgi:hypothetical protein